MLRKIFILFYLIILFFSSNLFAEENIINNNQRIISLAPDITELLFAAGLGDKIVGVMAYSDYPVAAKKIPIVAAFDHIDAEKILSLKPTIIVVPKIRSLEKQLSVLSLPIIYIELNHLTDIPKNLIKLGNLFGSQNIAFSNAKKFEKNYFALLVKYKNVKKIKVFYQIWSKPLLTITKNNWINDVIELCGGQNIFVNLSGSAPEISFESVVLKQPEVILSSNSKLDWQNDWRAWTQIPAVKHHHLFTINSDQIERASPRVLVGARQICRILAGARAS